MVYKCTRRRRCAPPPIRVRSASLSLRPLRLPSSCVYRLALPKMLIQGLGCSLQNEATITASIQMPLDLTFHARRELPFQVPANQMDGVPTVHSCPTSSGPAWVGPFSSQQCAIRPGEKLFKLEHSGLACSARSAFSVISVVIPSFSFDLQLSTLNFRLRRIYPLSFHILTHSFARRALYKSFGINQLRTLSVITGCTPPPLQSAISAILEGQT